MLLVLVMLSSLYAGLASPTEIGALMALLIAVALRRIALRICRVT